MAYYSCEQKKITILKSVKSKKQQVYTEGLVTATDVKCKFPLKMNSNRGTELLEGRLETRYLRTTSP